MKLREGLAEEALFARIHRLQRIWGASERALGFYLQDLDERGLYRKHGFANTIQLAAEEFEIPAKKTRELLRTARALAELPRIDAAYAGGRVSWSAVREITRVATSRTEEAWLELAEESGLRRVEGAVSRSEPGDPPPADPYGLTKTKIKIFAELPLEDYALWQTAFSRLAARHGPGLDSAKVLVFLLESFLTQPLNEAECGARKAFQVVYHRCSVCDRAWIQGGDGPQGIPPAAVRKAEREAGAEVIHLEEEEEGEAGGVPRGTDVPRGTSSPATALVPSGLELPRRQDLAGRRDMPVPDPPRAALRRASLCDGEASRPGVKGPWGQEAGGSPGGLLGGAAVVEGDLHLPVRKDGRQGGLIA